MEVQTAVWTLVDNDSLDQIVGYNEGERRDLVEWLSERTGLPVPPPPAVDDYDRNYNAPITKRGIRGSFSYDFPFPVNIRIAMFNDQHVVVRELMEEEQMSPGLHEFPFAFDASMFPPAEYHFKLIADGEVVVDRVLDMRRN